ncbi:MAG TPA: NAD(P)H-hydrate epimerase, partial [Candidatus Dormibacteraeota bacterium]
MALAAWQCARLARMMADDLGSPAPVAVLAGRGNNGGDALGCARHLAAWGGEVRVVSLAGLDDRETAWARQYQAVQAAGVPVRLVEDGESAALDWALAGAALVVDGLLGTGSRGPARGAVATAIG